MTVVSEGPLCLKIHLNKYEIKKYFESYGKINIEDPNVKKTIGTLFKIAVNMSDFETKGKRLIEVFPTVSGGCIIKFTSNPLPFQIETRKEGNNIKYKSKKNENNPYIFCFKNFENLIRVIELLYNNKTTQKYLSGIFKSKNKFFFKILIPVYDIKTAIFINEFSEYSTKGYLAENVLAEYAEAIIENNAITVLGKYFCNDSKTTSL